MSIGYHNQDSAVRWMRGGSVSFVEPFFSETIDGLRSQTPPALEFETDVDDLVMAVGHIRAVEPAGFIFHMSRCGSTLTLNALKAADQVVGLSEAQPFPRSLELGINSSVYWASVGGELIRSLAAIFGNYRDNDTEQVVVKRNVVAVRSLRLIRSIMAKSSEDRAPRMGAALAYYIALSLAPTVLILLAIAGLASGSRPAEGRLVHMIQGFVGYEGANAIQTMVEGARKSSRGVAATVLGLATVFFASSAVVSELRDAMNTIWKVPEDTTSSAVRDIFNLVKDRLASFVLVLASALFLVGSLIVNAWIFAAGAYLNPGAAPSAALVQTIDWVVSFVVITALIAFIFKVLPQEPLWLGRRNPWRDRHPHSCSRLVKSSWACILEGRTLQIPTERPAR